MNKQAAASKPVERTIELDTDAIKEPPSPSSRQNGAALQDETLPAGSAERGGEEELRRDPMMTTLLDALAEGKDIGHYGRLVFAMVARHFLDHDEVIAKLTQDRDFSEEQAQEMLLQVDSRDYSPPRRERLLEWQSEQTFQFMDASDPGSGNLYRNLRFPKEIYSHIGHYEAQKAEAA